MEDWLRKQCRACKKGIYMDMNLPEDGKDVLHCSFCDATVRRYSDPPEAKIKRNQAQCRKCNDIIESVHRHDFVSCKCGAIAVDGGKAYLRRVGNFGDVIELSETVE